MAVDMSMNILIVDDFKSMLDVMRNILTQLGFSNIDEATDGEMALEKFNEKEYGLVISDWNMEPMNGYELLKQIREIEDPHNEVPFIIVTAEGQAENVVAAKQAGVNNFIIKPFNLEIFKTKLSVVLGEF